MIGALLPRQCRDVSLAAVIGLLAFGAVARGQEGFVLAKGPRYLLPPKPIADLIDALPTPVISVGPNNKWMVLMQRAALPPIGELAQPELRLAGLRINPRTNDRSRRSYYTGLVFKQLADGADRPVTSVPDDPRIGHLKWSPNGKMIGFTIMRPGGLELWIAEVETGEAKRLTYPRLNGVYGTPYHWMPNSNGLLCRMVPNRAKEPPVAPEVPVAPTMLSSEGKTAPARTYQDLLKNAHDEKLFDYYAMARIAKVSFSSVLTPIGPRGIITRAEPSPDGKVLLVEVRHRPYSYLVPLSRFPKRVEIWDFAGNVVRVVADLPLAEEVPVAFGSVRTGARSFGWRADAPATVYWVEAQDGGDPRKEADVRDRVYTLSAPFRGAGKELVALNLRYGGIQWGDNHLALVSEWWWKNRRERTWKLDPSRPGSAPELLFDRTWEDRYNDPGAPLMRATSTGTSVLLTSGDNLFYRGRGASPEGDRPFLDKLNLKTQKSGRMWRSEAPQYEWLVELLDVNRTIVLTRRESPSEPPNYFVRDLRIADRRQITHFPDPTPQLAGVHKELIHYTRADGVKLSATLYLPPGYKPEDGPLPTLMWAYPQEFKSADLAGQVTDSPYRFVRVSAHSPQLWLLDGYAVLDDPSLPIIGEGDVEPNETYIEQLVAGAKAAVDEIVRRGVADRNRIAIGGHSYGAFMAANLLAHSDLFCAGIARSGAYNRTLTPFGFQAEERTLWEAPDVYFKMSPFMHADKINEPLLLIHGEADNNSGTFPLQSKRFYNALKGHGATARLVMLPHESHGYRARESVMHMAWEMTTWLDRFVKHAKSPTSDSTATPAKDTD